jgi:hypothetical protein
MMEKDVKSLLIETINLYSEKKRIDDRFERNKEKLRQITAGEKQKFDVPGIGLITVSEKKYTGFELDKNGLQDLSQEEYDFLVKHNILKVSLNQSAFKSIDESTREFILGTQCINEVIYEDGVRKQLVSIKLPASAKSENLETESVLKVNEGIRNSIKPDYDVGYDDGYRDGLAGEYTNPNKEEKRSNKYYEGYHEGYDEGETTLDEETEYREYELARVNMVFNDDEESDDDEENPDTFDSNI